MSSVSLEMKTVGELAAEVPNSIRVFETWKIDYCCGGRTPLADACANVGKSVDQFAAELSRMAAVPDSGVDWQSQSLSEMAANICSTYHAYTREELKTIAPIAQKVLQVHGSRRPELQVVGALIANLSGDMLPHMLKEEQVLFPYVDRLEEAAASGSAAPTPFFGTVKHPVRTMMMDHDAVGELLARLRSVTDEYTPPASACFSYRELYRRLAEFEQRTHEHVHVENNIYFVRAVALEDRAGEPASFGSGGCGVGGCNHST